jgi:hypothetical protein
MKETKYDRITIRFDPALGKKIRALAKRKGLAVADYCRLMCSLEVLNEEPEHPFTLVQQQLKETLGDVEAFAQQEPQHQAAVMRRCLDALTAARKAEEQAIAWLQAVARASDAFTRQKGARSDASPGDAGDLGTPDQR